MQDNYNMGRDAGQIRQKSHELRFWPQIIPSFFQFFFFIRIFLDLNIFNLLILWIIELKAKLILRAFLFWVYHNDFKRMIVE